MEQEESNQANQQQPNQGQPPEPPTPPVKASRYPFGENQASEGPPNQPPRTSPDAPPGVPSAQQQPKESQPAPQKGEGWRTALAIILLIFLPVIGVISMWFIAKWSTTVKLVITLIYAVIIIPIVVLSSIVILSLGSSRGAAYDARVASDIRSLVPPLEFYKDSNLKYPVVDSFSEMSSALVGAGVIDSELQEPTTKYHYKYCSTNGSAYKLEVEQLSTKDFFILGSDTCQPGE